MRLSIIFFLALFSNFLTACIVVGEDTDPPTGDIVVSVENIVEDKGTICVGLFNSEHTFRKIEHVYRYEVVKAANGEIVVIIEDVPFDDYALVIFQDFNENEKFDKSYLGLPKEPFGFSTNYEVISQAPDYDQVAFNHDGDLTKLDIELQVF
jgi:uncharacterized protein (DUF2141 family)